VNGCNSRSSYKLGWFYWAWFAGLLLFVAIVLTTRGRVAWRVQLAPTRSDAPGRHAAVPLVIDAERH